MFNPPTFTLRSWPLYSQCGDLFLNIHLLKTSDNFTTNYCFEMTNSNVTKYYSMRSLGTIHIYMCVCIYICIYIYFFYLLLEVLSWGSTTVTLYMQTLPITWLPCITPRRSIARAYNRLRKLRLHILPVAVQRFWFPSDSLKTARLPSAWWHLGQYNKYTSRITLHKAVPVLN